MESTRQNKISRLIQKDLGEIFQRNSQSMFSGAIITVTKVYVTRDLSIARVYLSIYGKDPKSIVKQAEASSKEIRKQLGIRIKNQVRAIPELQFFIDDSLDYIENIERLLKK